MKIISLILAIVLCCGLAMPVFAEAEALVYDEADILSNREEEKLNDKLVEISQAYDTQIFVITLETTDGEDVGDCAEEIYYGFGYDSDDSGILLLVSMEDPREYDMIAAGEAGEALGKTELDEILDAMQADMSDDAYAAAFDTYAEKCEYYLDGHINGFPFEAGTTLIIALVIGLVVGLISVLIMKGKLKSVRKQDAANVYVKSGSMQVTIHNDMFLYRNVTRTKKQSSSSSGSGSGGVSRSSGGRSF